MKVIIQYSLDVDISKYPYLSAKEIHNQVSEEITDLLEIGERRVFERIEDEQNIRVYKKIKSFFESEGDKYER